MPAGRDPRLSPLDAWCARALGLAPGQLDRDHIERYQLDRLRATVEWARARSPHHRGRISGAAPSSLADLGRLPTTTPAELRERGAQMVCVSQDEISRVVTLHSSGTTGPSKRLYFTAAEQESIIDFFAAGMATMVDPDERVVIFLPGPAPGTVADLLATALRRLGVVPIAHGFVRDVGEAAAALIGDRPTSLVALPVHALALARWAEQTAPGTISLKSALLTADYVPRSLARQVERAFSCPVFEHYGMTEMGLGGGVECEAHDGYHLREADLLFEVVDPPTGTPLPDGAEGEVVFTTLTRRAMPLVRYRTGDLARMIAGPCRCGSALRRLARVRGRIGAAALGAIDLPALDELVFACPGVVDHRATIAAGPSGPALHITALTLGPEPPDGEVAHRLAAVAQELPRAAVELASLDGRLQSGPEKRTLGRQDGA
jgi:phenylacetate-coenzyme A ligase PaaK-like adenylate-forming protein